MLFRSGSCHVKSTHSNPYQREGRKATRATVIGDGCGCCECLFLEMTDGSIVLPLDRAQRVNVATTYQSPHRVI